jgi:hypothetical protein
VFTWAYGRGVSGQEPSSITIGARLACLGSFYRFPIGMKYMLLTLDTSPPRVTGPLTTGS